CLFFLNGACSVTVVGALSSVTLENNVFSCHLRGPAVTIADLSTSTIRDNSFTHNLRGIHVSHANPSIADCAFMANSVAVETFTGATTLISNCVFVDDILSTHALEGSF